LDYNFGGFFKAEDGRAGATCYFGGSCFYSGTLAC